MTPLSWLKLDVNILNDSKIKIIRKYPGGNDLVVLWIGLLCLAMRSNRPGIIELTDGIPYTEEELANEIGIEIKTVQMGLIAFEKLKMIEVFQDNTLAITNFMKHQEFDRIENEREKTRIRVAKYRQKLLSNGKTRNGNVTVDVTACNDTEKIREEKIREEKIREEEIYYKNDFIKKAWEKWKDYKYTQFKFYYKSINSEQTGINKLTKLCNNNFNNAILIVEESISNGWSGLFELKTSKSNKYVPPTASAEERAADMERRRREREGQNATN